MLGYAVTPWILVHIPDHLSEIGHIPDLNPFEFEPKDPAFPAGMPVVPFGVTVEKQRKGFVQAAGGIVPDPDQEVKMIAQQAVREGLRDRTDVGLVKLQEKTERILIIKKGISVPRFIINMIVLPGFQ